MEPGPQFEGYTGGPAEAHAAINPPRRDLYEPKSQGEQTQLFHPESVAMPEAHHQTPAQFAADPRTWFHGRYTAERSRLGGAGTKEGFHAGTEGAARQRLKALQGRRSPKEGVGGHLFPLRITGPVAGPEHVQPDVNVHRRLGRGSGSYGWEAPQPPAPIKGGGYLYENKVEAAGSISAGVPRRKGFLSTHREMVQAAQKSGEKVHPNIAWAAKAAPEHTGETIPQNRWADPTPHGQRYAQHHLSYDTATASNQEKMARTSYQTESGRTKHVWRYRDPTPGSALLSKQQWQPSN